MRARFTHAFSPRRVAAARAPAGAPRRAASGPRLRRRRVRVRGASAAAVDRSLPALHPGRPRRRRGPAAASRAGRFLRGGRRCVGGGGDRVLVRRAAPRPPHGLRGDLRHARDDGGAPDASLRIGGPCRESRQRACRDGAHQRPRTLLGGAHPRPLAARGGGDRDARPRDGPGPGHPRRHTRPARRRRGRRRRGGRAAGRPGRGLLDGPGGSVRRRGGRGARSPEPRAGRPRAGPGLDRRRRSPPRPGRTARVTGGSRGARGADGRDAPQLRGDDPLGLAPLPRGGERRSRDNRDADARGGGQPGGTSGGTGVAPRRWAARFERGRPGRPRGGYPNTRGSPVR